MKIDKERRGFPIHILYSPICVDVFIFPVNVLYYTHKSIFFPFLYSVYSSMTALYVGGPKKTGLASESAS